MKPARIPVPGMDGWNYERIDGLWFRIKHMTHSDVRGKVEQVIIAKRSANRKEIAWIKEQLAIGDLHPFAEMSDTRTLASSKRKSIDSGRAT